MDYHHYLQERESQLWNPVLSAGPISVQHPYEVLLMNYISKLHSLMGHSLMILLHDLWLKPRFYSKYNAVLGSSEQLSETEGKR